MNKKFIFLSILIIGTIAFLDAKDRFAELDAVASSKTPAQIEMLAPLNRKDIESKHIKFQDNTQNMHDKFRKENQKNHQQNQSDLYNNMNKKSY